MERQWKQDDRLYERQVLGRERDDNRDVAAEIRSEWALNLRYPERGCGSGPMFLQPHPSGPVCSIAVVTEVVDGDTLRLRNGELVRIAGVDAPETYPSPSCGGLEAKAALQQALTGPLHNRWNPLGPLPVTVLLKRVGVHPDRDTYGRLLRQVEIVTASPRGNPPRTQAVHDLGYWLISRGWARFDKYAYTHYAADAQDLSDLDLFFYAYASGENNARKSDLGMWRTCR